MRIYSEITKKEYKTVDECLAAEKKYAEDQKALQKEEKEKAATKKMRADEVQNAYAKVCEAQKEYIKLRNAFVEDYGYFHMTYRSSDDIPFFNFFEDFFRFPSVT